jgi:hypothetical protein
MVFAFLQSRIKILAYEIQETERLLFLIMFR